MWLIEEKEVEEEEGDDDEEEELAGDSENQEEEEDNSHQHKEGKRDKQFLSFPQDDLWSFQVGCADSFSPVKKSPTHIATSSTSAHHSEMFDEDIYLNGLNTASPVNRSLFSHTLQDSSEALCTQKPVTVGMNTPANSMAPFAVTYPVQSSSFPVLTPLIPLQASRH